MPALQTTLQEGGAAMSGAPVWAYYDRYEQYYPGQDGSQASYGARQPPQNRGGPGGYMPAYGHMMPQAFTGYPIDPRCGTHNGDPDKTHHRF